MAIAAENSCAAKRQTHMAYIKTALKRHFITVLTLYLIEAKSY